MARKRRKRKTRRIREARARLQQEQPVVNTVVIEHLSTYIEQNKDRISELQKLDTDEPVAPSNPIKSRKKKPKAKKVSKKRVTKKRATKKKVLANED